jgi:thiol-disulfide isomerase/thioredoxin
MVFRSLAFAAFCLVVAAIVWHYRWPVENALHPRHPATPLVVGQMFPRISAMPVGGARPQTIAPPSGRFLYINVFATWCGPCRAETPALKRLSDETTRGPMQIVGIDQHESDEAVSSFSRSYGLTFPMFVSRDAMTSSALGVHFIPVTIIVDPNGVVRADVIGPMSYERMQTLVLDVVGPRAFNAKV